MKDINIDRNVLKERATKVKQCENNFKNYIEKKYPLKEFKVYNRIHNIKLSNNKETFGIYTLYRVSENKEYLKKYLEFLEKSLQYSTEFILETRVKIRDEVLADKIAREKNEIFIDITNFILSNYISIEKVYFREDRYSLVISNDDICENTHNEFNISSDFDVIKKSPYFSKLIFLAEEREPSFIESKIKLALHWYREFLHEKSEINSLLKGVIALESLISTKKLVKKIGIQSYISSIVPIILKEDETSLSIKIKQLYKKRSEIVHNGTTEIYLSDIKNLKEILLGILEEFITKEKYKNLTSEKEYNNFFKEISKNKVNRFYLFLRKIFYYFK